MKVDSTMVDDKDFINIQKELWDVVNSHITPDNADVLLALSGSMLNIAIELYTVVLKDEDIENLLDVVASDIPKMRTKIRKRLDKRMLH